jgi:hypothetical protein
MPGKREVKGEEKKRQKIDNRNQDYLKNARE